MTNKHIEAAAAAIKSIKVFRPTSEDMAQAAWDAIVASLAASGDEGIHEAAKAAFRRHYLAEKGAAFDEAMRAALGVARAAIDAQPRTAWEAAVVQAGGPDALQRAEVERQRLAEVERDAARYRFLRGSAAHCVTRNIGHDWVEISQVALDCDLDAASANGARAEDGGGHE